MAEPVKPRPYRAPRRRAQAQRPGGPYPRRRRSPVRRARLRRHHHGRSPRRPAWPSPTTCTPPSAQAALFRLLLETAISGTDRTVPAVERDYVRAIQAEPDPAAKLAVYAAAVATIQARMAPLYQVLQQAATAELSWPPSGPRSPSGGRPTCACSPPSWPRPAGCVPAGVEEAADALVDQRGPELYLLLVGRRGWDLTAPGAAGRRLTVLLLLDRRDR